MLLTQSQSGSGGAGKRSDDTLLEIAKDILSKVNTPQYSKYALMIFQLAYSFVGDVTNIFALCLKIYIFC